MSFKMSIEIMKEYLLLKFSQEDWHGVSDAANDIRELIAREKENDERKNGEVENVYYHIRAKTKRSNTRKT